MIKHLTAERQIKLSYVFSFLFMGLALVAGLSDNIGNLIVATTGIIVTFHNIWMMKISERFDELEEMIKLEEMIEEIKKEIKYDDK